MATRKETPFPSELSINLVKEDRPRVNGQVKAYVVVAVGDQ